MTATAFALDPVDSAHITNQAVAAEVRAAMARRRVNQTQMAKRLGMGQASMSRRLSGEIPFDIVELARAADVLGITLHELIPTTISRWYMRTADQETRLSPVEPCVGQLELGYMDSEPVLELVR